MNHQVIDIEPSTTDKQTVKFQQIPMSNKLIAKYGLTNILTIQSISNMQNLEQVFNGFNYVILYMALEENFGHWICLFISSNDKLHYFDSYGYAPLYMIDKIKKKRGQNMNLLTLIKNSKYKNKFNYNTVDYQAETTAVCGRYCVMVCVLNMITKCFSCIKYKAYIEHAKKLTHKSYDFIVSEFVSK